MKRWQKVLTGSVLAVCVAASGALWYFQNEVQALKYHLDYSEEEQAALVEQNEERMNEILEQVQVPVSVADSAAQAVMQEQSMPQNKPETIKNQAEKQPAKQPVKSEASKPEQKPGQQNYDPELAGMIGEIYALRTSFTGQLDQLLAEAKQEYIAVPENQRDKQKPVILNKYIKKAGGLEANCDGQMNEILGRMKTHLKKTGGDASLTGEIQKVYENEKALKKAYYMSLAK